MKPVLGNYHPLALWADSRCARSLSLLDGAGGDLEAWRTRGRAKVHELLAYDPPSPPMDAQVMERWEAEGCVTERVSWAQPFGPRTEAFLIRPSGSAERLPGIVALHDHSGFYYFGKEKIAAPKDGEPEILKELKTAEYGGASWANECARRGYAVLVPDVFLWGSRRLDPGSIPEQYTHTMQTAEPGSRKHIETYNDFIGGYETYVAKTLFLSGTTWTGIMAWEDRRALDYLASRPDVDTSRLGCAGLSGGGLRTIYLSGLDPRIRCAVCVGFMSTNREVLDDMIRWHTWMYHVPHLSAYMDLPDVVSLHGPQPLLLQYDTGDPIWTLAGQERADAKLKKIYAAMGAPDNYRGGFYPGPHKFDRAMQKDAFDWFDARLK
jgi:dienelactone hydrolase